MYINLITITSSKISEPCLDSVFGESFDSVSQVSREGNEGRLGYLERTHQSSP
jgi:hypothetical protein